MNSLALNGRLATEGFGTWAGRVLLRLADPASPPLADADAALVRSEEDRDRALSSGYSRAVSVGLGAEVTTEFRTAARFGGGCGWLAAGDVIAIEPTAGRYRVLWRRNSAHNAFLVTDRCDHNCLMCSQPPKDVEDGWILDEIRACLPLLPRNVASLGFTGGEPFLDWQRFIPVVEATQTNLQSASVHVLTNGRAFARAEIVSAWSALDRSRACVGIPIYSAVDSVHDHIVQSRGAFDDTVLGVLRLKDCGNRVEIRVVLHRLTVARLVETCAWLTRNLPFVDHVALMGMEDTGFALANHGALWIDPVDYGPVLAHAIDALSAAGMRVSVYNLPLCVLPRSARPYAAQSISDWKNAHPEVCTPCRERAGCAGFFTTGRTKWSRGIAPIEDATAFTGSPAQHLSVAGTPQSCGMG